MKRIHRLAYTDTGLADAIFLYFNFENQAVSEKKIFEIVDGRTTDDGRTPDHGHPISSPCEPNGSAKNGVGGSVNHKIKKKSGLERLAIDILIIQSNISSL